MTTNYLSINSLKVSKELSSFVDNELLIDTGITSKNFWLGFDKAVNELAPKNKELLKIRENLQKEINEWHIKNKGLEINKEEYKKFLKKNWIS